jgi:hypothetical protein
MKTMGRCFARAPAANHDGPSQKTPHGLPGERSSLDDRHRALQKKVNQNAAALAFVRHETLPV